MATVDDIMTHHVVRVNADDPLHVVRHKLGKGGFHHLPVMDRGELLGIISDRDVLGALSPFLDSPSERSRDLRTLQKKAHQVMTPQPYTILSTASVESAGQMLLALDISALPVIDLEGSLIGIVTWHDLLDHFVESPEDEDAA
ncbi:MAG: CBS domain-containing protein [Rhodothermales bacterium]|nr:CBS domain-containing protein [Rhodothermales bacterium]MBO6779091.1 CBS domain-containing protein [Rhodothermales bacterium]